jgi:hypothetical protein
MAATELSITSPRRWLPAGAAKAWLRVYTAICAATTVSATFVAGGGSDLTQPVRQLLGAQLTPRENPPPSLAHILALAAHNTPIAAWPLLLGVIGANRHRLARQLADTLVMACLLVNTLVVGAALGAYGAPLLPYLPQLPLEWAGLALGAGSWLVQRDHEITTRQRLVWLALTAGVLFCAAALETVAVPHR